MIHTYLQPSAHLRDYIKVYKLLHFRFGPHDPVPVKPFTASPNQGISFYPRGFLTAHDPTTGIYTRRPQTVVFGQHVSRLNLHLCQGEFMLFDVSFQPGILSKFLRLPLGEFVNKNMDAEAVLSAEIHRVNEQLAHAGNYDSMVRIVENYLWKRIQSQAIDVLPIDKVSRLIVDRAAAFSLDQWASHACLSISAFERRFSQQMGVSPKLFSRIIRFDQAVQLREANPHLDWLSIALQTGYTDYQHLVKDFKQFAGTTPTILLREDATAPERRLGLV